MIKRILMLALALSIFSTITVSAEYNKYNEEPYINIYNNTLGDICEITGISLEEFLKENGFPEDMTEDTNEMVAFYMLTIENYAKLSDLPLDELILEAETLYGKKINKDTLYKDFENQLTVKDWIGDSSIEEFKRVYELGDEVKEDTLYKDINIQISRNALANSGLLKYFTPDSILVMLKGKYLDFDVAPLIINDRTMVPMRVIFESLGATVHWDDDAKTVYANKDDISIALKIGASELFKNGESKPVDSPAIIINDRTLVPLRAIAEALDVQVGYVEDTKTVVIH